MRPASQPRRIFVLIILAFVITACRGPLAASSPARPTRPVPVSPTAPAKLVPTILAATQTPAPTALPQIEAPIIWYLRGTAPVDLTQVNDQLNRLLATRGYNAKVEIRPVDSLAFARRMAEIQSAGEAWDLVSLSGDNYRSWVEKSSLLPLSNPAENLIQSRAPGLWDSFPEPIWKALRFEKSIYAVPNPGIWLRPRGVSIRADVVRALDMQADLDQLHSFSDLTPLLARIQAAVQDGTLEAKGIADVKNVKALLAQADLLRPENAGYDLLAGPFAVRYDDPGAQITNWYRTAEFKKLAELRRSWQQAGYLPDEPLTPEQVLQGYREGRYWVEVGHQVWPGSALDQSAHLGYEWIDQPLGPSFITTSAVLSSVTAVNARIAQDPERVSRVLLLLDLVHTDPEIYNLLAYGIEGQHWRWQDQAKKVITLAPGSGYLPDYVDQLGDRTLSYSIGPRQAGLWDAIHQENASAPVSTVFGFTFDPRPAAGETFTLQGLLPELLDPFANGQVKDIEKALPRLHKSLEDAGAPAVAAELKNQLDAWKTAR